MKMLFVGALLIVGIGAGYQSYLATNDGVNALSTEDKKSFIDGNMQILLAGNVPCNPAKQVCED